MLLENKNAVVYGAGGAVGGAVARAFAREGARVFLTGRSKARLDAVADEIAAAGGRSEVAQVDALDRDEIEAHAASVARAGGIDISFNAIWIRGDLQGTPLLEMSVEDFTTPINVAATTHFLTATAAARHMVDRGTGVILTLSTSSARLPGRDQRFHATGGFGSRAARSRRSRGCLPVRSGRAACGWSVCGQMRCRRRGRPPSRPQRAHHSRMAAWASS